MKILVGRDTADEADLLSLYLSGGGDNEVALPVDAEDLVAQARDQVGDVVLLELTYPTTVDQGYALYEQLLPLVEGSPVVMACRPSEMINLPRFLIRGLRFYLSRDPQGDYIFLVLSTLESAVAALRADEGRKLAEPMRREINGVRMLQEAIIPHGLTPPGGYSAVARYEPAQIGAVGGHSVNMAGGDYYDMFTANETMLIALVGDASDPVLEACMSIMTMHTLVRMLGTTRFNDTAGFVGEINSLLCTNSIVQSGGGFITLLSVAVDTLTHRVSWTSAGHPPALLHHLDSNEVEQIGANSDGDLPLGITGGMPYDAMEFVMPPRSRLRRYSDALAPGEGKGGSAYGFKGSVGRHDVTSILLLERSVA